MGGMNIYLSVRAARFANRGRRMITLPPEYLKTRINGYFWNIKLQALFSIKRGILTELKLNAPFFHQGKGPKDWHYAVSDKGQRRILSLTYLQKLDPIKHGHGMIKVAKAKKPRRSCR